MTKLPLTTESPDFIHQVLVAKYMVDICGDLSTQFQREYSWEEAVDMTACKIRDFRRLPAREEN